MYLPTRDPGCLFSYAIKRFVSKILKKYGQSGPTIYHPQPGRDCQRCNPLIPARRKSSEVGVTDPSGTDSISNLPLSASLYLLYGGQSRLCQGESVEFYMLMEGAGGECSKGDLTRWWVTGKSKGMATFAILLGFFFVGPLFVDIQFPISTIDRNWKIKVLGASLPYPVLKVQIQLKSW